MAGLEPERPAQHAGVAAERDHPLQRNLVAVMPPGAELAVGPLGQQRQAVQLILGLRFRLGPGRLNLGRRALRRIPAVGE